ncbi:MAG: HD domain-containing protein [Moheibacter sp.]
MEYLNLNKLKVFNDPVHGFISIPNELIFDLIQHRFFQRLRRICQTGMTELVYPGARHSRFHHALGALHLMQKAVETLRLKNVEISAEEENGVYCAILLHDIGHGPYSHTLEKTLIEGLTHEHISLRLMELLNVDFSGELDLAIEIFKGKHPRKFLTQLVSSQLDMDRLDYLKRDSFFTGVVEGNINPERIISTLNVVNDELVIDLKGIYSVEKYLIARMFMYWQVYNHKTSFSAEVFLTQALKRAKELGTDSTSETLNYFLSKKTETANEDELNFFVELDDSDILSSLKQWQNHPDKILSFLSRSLINRNLPVSKVGNQNFGAEEIETLKKGAAEMVGVIDGSYFVHQSKIEVIPYDRNINPIQIKYKDGKLSEITKSSQQILSAHLTNPIEKFHLCYLAVKKKT